MVVAKVQKNLLADSNIWEPVRLVRKEMNGIAREQ
jgi:hypothetical protein